MAEMTTNYRIGSSEEYIKKVLGILNSSVLFRNSSLSYNPGYRRYYSSPEAYSMIYNASDIGEEYVKDDSDVTRENFLDEVGGLVGYTFQGGYLNTNNYKVVSRFEELERNQKGQFFQTLSPFNRIGRPYYEKHEFKDNIKFLYNTDLSYLPVVFDLTYLDRLYEYYTKERHINIYGNSSTYGEFNPVRHAVNEYFPGDSENGVEGNEYVKSNSSNKRYSVNEETHYEHGDSVDNNIDTKGYGNAFVRDYSNTSLNGVKYGLYQENDENGKDLRDFGKGDVNDNYSNAVSIFGIEENSKKGLIAKTNDLFRQGKIGSLINRFHGKSEGFSEFGGKDESHGYSRGRNLTKKDGSTTHNGYDNPYCRVWTSHYQYSKYKNTIRPFIKDGIPVSPESFDEKDIVKSFRPFENIRSRSSLQDNGLPLIAPIDAESVKRCMFSIENLAWKDINFNEKVYNRKKTVDGKRQERGSSGHGKVLSPEQQGPNGGRIMWFPPYNLKFSENVGVSWNENNFIGRGESIYSYTNTQRSGQLQFTILIDHPSILDKYSASVGQPDNNNDLDVLRFFAGCGELEQQGNLNNSKENIDKKPDSNEPSVDPTPEELFDEGKMLFCFFPNDFSGEDFIKDGNEWRAINYLQLGGSRSGNNGYEGGSGVQCTPINGCIDTQSAPKDFITCKNKKGDFNTWYYQVDSSLQDEVLLVDNYKDKSCYGLNSENVINILTESGTTESGEITVRNGEIARSVLRISDLSREEILNSVIPFSSIDLIRSYFNATTPTGEYNKLDIAKKVKIRCVGYASSHGYGKSNQKLALNRATLLQNYLIKNLGFDRSWFEEPVVVDYGVSVTSSSVSDFKAKVGRCAGVFIEVQYDKNVTLDRLDSGNMVSEVINKITESQIMSATTSGDTYVETTVVEEANYDDEYLYFKKVDMNDDFVRQYITDKVKYFDPAFHSITPEGFNARLTFLHQCTRQGPTVSVSENSATKMMAGNLAFGRPPVCVLRIGDFYNTKIIIDSLSIDYDNSGGIQWDMNTEGIGLQPMIANITIGFKFLGGSDLSGPISRLQNAVSYNFFANTSVYDRHADYREGWIRQDIDEVNEWEVGINDDKKEKEKEKNNNE